MRDLALHVLDLAQNSVRAGACRISVRMLADQDRDALFLQVADDGCGMDAAAVACAADPFCSSRPGRRIGLGLSLLQAGVEAAEGTFALSSQPGRGTCVRAVYRLSHADRPPAGDMAGTLLTLMMSLPELDFVIAGKMPEQTRPEILDTRRMRLVMPDLRLNEPEVAAWIGQRLHRIFPSAFRHL